MSNSLDLDPTFVRALRLLHSKSIESTEQLKQLMIDAIANRKAKTDTNVREINVSER